jgi:hypothetical protein
MLTVLYDISYMVIRVCVKSSQKLKPAIVGKVPTCHIERDKTQREKGR